MNNPEKAITTLLATVFSIVGTSMLAGSFFSFNSTKNFINNSSSTTGVVIELKEVESTSRKSRSIVYYPLIKFEPKQGKAINFQAGTGTNPPSYNVGETVPVLYNPNNPYKAEINSFFDLWFSFILLLLMGGVFTGVGATMFLINLGLTKKLSFSKEVVKS